VFTLRWSHEARKQYDSLREAARRQKSGRNAGVFKAVHKCVTILPQNPKHPGLNTHKYSSIQGPAGQDIFEAYAQNRTPGAYRVFWYYGPSKDEITVLAITPHP
jgi:hypothetical protein